MWLLIARRLLSAVPVMLIVATAVFLLLRLAPGDPARVIAGDMATEEAIEAIRANMGLNESVGTQYGRWIWALIQGDLGRSAVSNQPVTQLITARLGPTASLAISAIAFTILASVPLGALAAWRHRERSDRVVSAVAVLGFSVPTFVVGYVLILLFSVKLGWLPVQGYRPFSDGAIDYLQRLVLPTASLSGVFIALVTRITRASMLDILGEDFIRTARAKGVTEPFVLFRHALRNAAIPIVTVIGLAIASLFSGVVVIETVFNIAGVGRLIVDSVLARDYPVVQGSILFFSFVYIAINLAIDIVYVILDPRIRY